MADEPNDVILHSLQELREQMREIRAAQERASGQLSDLKRRIDGNTLVLNLIAGVIQSHKSRLKALENR